MKALALGTDFDCCIRDAVKLVTTSLLERDFTHMVTTWPVGLRSLPHPTVLCLEPSQFSSPDSGGPSAHADDQPNGQHPPSRVGPPGISWAKADISIGPPACVFPNLKVSQAY